MVEGVHAVHFEPTNANVHIKTIVDRVYLLIREGQRQGDLRMKVCELGDDRR